MKLISPPGDLIDGENSEKFGSKFPTFALKKKNQTRDQMKLLFPKGQGLWAFNEQSWRRDVGLGMSSKGTHSSDEDDHVVPGREECLLKSEVLAAHGVPGLLPASKCPSRAFPADQQRHHGWGQTQEKSWHSSGTSHGMDLGLRPLVSKLLVQPQHLNMIPHLIDLFSKNPREVWGHQWFISAHDSTADFPANCKPKGLPYCLIHHIALGCNQSTLTPASAALGECCGEEHGPGFIQTGALASLTYVEGKLRCQKHPGMVLKGGTRNFSLSVLLTIRGWTVSPQIAYVEILIPSISESDIAWR